MLDIISRLKVQPIGNNLTYAVNIIEMNLIFKEGFNVDAPVIIIYVVCILAFFYLFLIRPQKKRDKQASLMLGSMAVGDGVVTIGGVIGTIVLIKDDEVVIETSIDKTKLSFRKVAIKEVIKPAIEQ